MVARLFVPATPSPIVESLGGGVPFALQEKVGSPLPRSLALYGPMLPSCPLWHLNDQDDLGDNGREREREVHGRVLQGVAGWLKNYPSFTNIHPYFEYI